MKKYPFSKTWNERGKRRVVRANTEEEMWEKYHQQRYGIPGITQPLDQKIIDKLKEKGADISVEEWALQAIERYKKGNVTERTYREYIQATKKNLLQYLGDRPISAVTTADLQDVLNRQQGMSTRQISQVFQIIMFVFKTAGHNGYISQNPAMNLLKPKGREKQKRRPLYPEERVALLSLFNQSKPDFLIFEIMYYTGARPSECWNMVRDDIVTRDGVRLLHIRGTKTKSADRWVPLPDNLWKKVRKKKGLLCTLENGNGYGKQSYLRKSKRLKREMSLCLGSETYRNQITDDKLSPDFVPYCIRHDFCCRLKNEGVDIRTAQYLMGHSNISVTADIYTHTTIDDVITTAKALGV